MGGRLGECILLPMSGSPPLKMWPRYDGTAMICDTRCEWCNWQDHRGECNETDGDDVEAGVTWCAPWYRRKWLAAEADFARHILVLEDDCPTSG